MLLNTIFRRKFPDGHENFPRREATAPLPPLAPFLGTRIEHSTKGVLNQSFFIYKSKYVQDIVINIAVLDHENA